MNLFLPSFNRPHIWGPLPLINPLVGKIAQNNHTEGGKGLISLFSTIVENACRKSVSSSHGSIYLKASYPYDMGVAFGRKVLFHGEKEANCIVA